MYKDVHCPPLLQKQNEITTYPSTDNWLDKLWYIHMAQYYAILCNCVCGLVSEFLGNFYFLFKTFLCLNFIMHLYHFSKN